VGAVLVVARLELAAQSAASSTAVHPLGLDEFPLEQIDQDIALAIVQCVLPTIGDRMLFMSRPSFIFERGGSPSVRSGGRRREDLATSM
jgi:hypothetical protein